MASKVNHSSQTTGACDVFISYRRDGGDMTAMYFYQALRERGYRVFYDLEVLRAGKFNEALLGSIQSCSDFLLILSPHALDRCDDPNDWVRREIAEALRTKKNIVPVMLKGFAFPEKLPEEIDDIRYRNGLTCTTEYFEESINRLCDRYLSSLPAQAAKKRSPLIPVLAVIAALAVAFGGYMAFKGGKSPAPTPEPTATVEITSAPTATPAPTEAPTEAPTATPAPTDAPGPQVVKDTDFPVLSALIDAVDGEDETGEGLDFDVRADAHVLGHATLRRRDVASLTFLPTLDGAPADAWDVSEAGDGRALAWITPNGELYDLFIAGDGGVKIVDSDVRFRPFSAYYNVKSIDFNGCVDLSGRTNLGEMFMECRRLERVNLAGVCTENATCMRYMFSGCTSLKALDLSGLDTASVEDFEGMFMGCESLAALDVSGFDTHRALSMDSMFMMCSSLRALDLSHFDTSGVTTMRNMFTWDDNLAELNLSGFNTARVIDMGGMFQGCLRLETVDLSAFDTARVTTMAQMFAGCSGLQTLDLTGFDTANVESMNAMFENCARLDNIDLSGFDTGSVADMGNMFNGCAMLYRLDLSDWDTRRVTNMQQMFANCGYAVELLVTNWDVSSVDQMDGMFQGDGALKRIGRDPAAFGHGNTLDMYDGCDKLEGVDRAASGAGTAQAAAPVKDTDFPVLTRALDEVAGDDTGDGEADQETQRNAPFLNHPTLRRRDVASLTFLPTLDGAPSDAWDVSEAGDGRALAWITPNGELYDLFIAGDGGVKLADPAGVSRLFRSLSGMKSVRFNGCVDCSERRDLGSMFAGCHSLEEVDLSGLCTESATTLAEMFAECHALRAVDLSGLDTSRVENMAGMFQDCGSLEALDLTGFDTGRVTAMNGMFQNCVNLTALDLTGLNTAWVRYFDSMFENCRSLRTLDVSGFDTSRAESFARMFADCRSLDAIDVSGFDTSRLEWMPGMFYGCERLRSIDVSGFDTSRVTGMFDLFWECMDLEQVDVSHFDTSNVEDMGRMFFECNHLEAVDVSGFDTSSCVGMDFMFAVTPLRQVDVSGFDTGNVRRMDRMFMSCPELESLDLSGWDVSNVEDMQLMFMDCRALTTIGRSPAVFAHGNAVDMYKNCACLPGADAAPLVKNTDFPALYRGMDVIEGVTELDDDADRKQRGDAPAFNLPNLRRRDVASVAFRPTLAGAPADAVDVSEAGDGRVLAWAVPNGALYDLTIAGDGGVKVLEREGSSPMFSYFFNLERVDFNGCVDFSERTDFSRLFWCCHNLKEAHLDGVYTGSAVTFSGLFGGCWVLESLDVSMFDTSAAESFDGMFLDCSLLPALDVGFFDTSRARVTESMFIGCESLASLDLSRWDVSNVEDMTDMFRNCRSLEGIGRDPAAFGRGRTDGMYDGCDSLKIN